MAGRFRLAPTRDTTGHSNILLDDSDSPSYFNMIAIFDAGMRCRSASAEFHRAFRGPGNRLTGLHVDDIFRATELEDAAGLMRRAMAGEDIHLDCQLALHDGRRRCFRLDLVPYEPDRAYAPECCAVLTDITQVREALEQALAVNAGMQLQARENSRRLAALNKEMESFSYAVSHDLQAPLRRIDRYAELLCQDGGGALTNRERDMLDGVRRAVLQTNRMLADLKNLAGVARATLNVRTVAVSELATVVLAELAATTAQPRREIEIDIEPDIRMEADPALLRDLLESLLANAWKFSQSAPRGRIEVRALAVEDGPGFLVRDNGAGFDMRFADKLFGAFQRLHSQSEFAGSGIGLAIARRIVNLHGWEITATGDTGKGATFSVIAR